MQGPNQIEANHTSTVFNECIFTTLGPSLSSFVEAISKMSFSNLYSNIYKKLMKLVTNQHTEHQSGDFKETHFCKPKLRKQLMNEAY